MDRHGDGPSGQRFHRLPSEDGGEEEQEEELAATSRAQDSARNSGAGEVEKDPRRVSGSDSGRLRWFVITASVASTAFVVANGLPFFLPLVSLIGPSVARLC